MLKAILAVLAWLAGHGMRERRSPQQKYNDWVIDRMVEQFDARADVMRRRFEAMTADATDAEIMDAKQYLRGGR